MNDSLVVLSLEPWDEVWRRNQYLVDGLLRRRPGLKVLFVEPSSDLVHSLGVRRRPRLGAGLRRVPGQDRLWRLQLTKPLPRVAGPAADRWLVRGLRRATERLGMDRPILWVNDPGWAPAVAVTDWPTLYDITDDWVVAERAGRVAQRTLKNDEYLLGAVDAVIVCSKALQEVKGVTRPVVLIPNAVDGHRYREPQNRPTDLPPGPTALYVGTLHEDRLDTQLVVETARQVDALGGTVVLVGPNALGAEERSLLDDAVGLRQLGRRPHEQIPAYLQHADLLIVPHVVTPFTERLDPIKVYEYLAVGRPILSTPVAGFRERADDDLLTVTDRTAFPRCAVTTLRSEHLASCPRTVPAWSDRVEELQALLEELP